MKKNIFDRFQDNLVKQVEKFEKREDKDILKKIPLWMILFFPYGLYLFIFKSKIKKRFKAIVAIISALIIFLFIDITLHPNRVYDKVGKESYEQFVSENTDLGLDNPSYASKASHFEIDNQMYFSFNIYDKLNMYHAIFKVNDYNKDYEIVSIYDIDYNFNNVYAKGEFNNVKDIHPVILNLLLSSGKDINLSNIHKVSDVKENDLFDNIIYQDVKIKEKTYSFQFNDFSVLKIVDTKSKKELYSAEFTDTMASHMPKVVFGLLKKNFNSNYKVVGYNYFNSKHYYNVNVAGEDYSIEYLPGVDAKLLSISNKEEFTSHLESLMMK